MMGRMQGAARRFGAAALLAVLAACGGGSEDVAGPEARPAAVDPSIGRLPAGTTDRFLMPWFATRNVINGYIVDPLDPNRTAALSPALRVNTVTRKTLGGSVDATAGVVRRYGARALYYTPGDRDLQRVLFDRAAALPAAATAIAPALAICDSGYRYLGASRSGGSVLYAYALGRACFRDDGVFAIDVGPAGNRTPFGLPGVPIDVTYDARGNIDGILVWTGPQSLGYYHRATGVLTAVAVVNGAPRANNGVFAHPTGGQDSIATLRGIFFRDADGVVWRFDKARRSLSAPLWQQLQPLRQSPHAVYPDALTVAGFRIDDLAIWRVRDSSTPTVRVLTRGRALNVGSVRFTRDYVVFRDERAENVAISRIDGRRRWIGGNQIGPDRAQQVFTTILSNTVLFGGTPLGGVPRVVGIELGTLTRPDPVLNAEFAGLAMSDVVPLWAAPGQPLSHLLAWRRESGRSDYGRARLDWIDMATGRAVASSGRLPDAAYDLTSIPGTVVAGHAGIGTAGSALSSSTVNPVSFTFGIAPGSLRVFTPPN